MFENLASYLTSKAGLTSEELRAVEKAVVPKKIRKRQYLLQEGDVSRYNAFVVKGCLRLYQVGKDGTEHIMRFAIEDWWISDYESYNSGLPSRFNIDALEDSELLIIEKNKLNDLLESIPKLKHLIQRLDAKNFEVTQTRILSNISQTAEEKYESFVSACPKIYNRVPLHMIASFLGLSRETLSRVRQQHVRKSQILSR
jgi:CRP-like cAMP-binding protein